MTRPQFVSASTAQLDELVGLAKTRTAFSAEQYWLLEQVLDTFAHVMLALQNAKTSIKLFRQMLFGRANAVTAPRAVRNELIRQAAQAPLLHSDDTTAKVLAISTERARLEAAGQTPEALAVNTSGIVAIVSPEHKVALYFTGHQHAGKNLADVLAHRARSLAAPTQLSDALACNFAGPLGTIVAKCLAHGRRKVVEVLERVGDTPATVALHH